MSARSKLLSLVLRHAPERAGVTLDPRGWVEVEALLAGLAAQGEGMSRAELEAIVRDSDKKRFTLSPDGERIRAAQGHSVGVELGLPDLAPPETLFHGTAERSLAAILEQGLRPGARRKVHLSADRDTARRVGGRHGRPVVLTVAAGAMQREGLRFQQAENGVWLTDGVPPAYLAEDLSP